MDQTSCTNSKRPPKLRSACNECHAAKVRCSGEKTGCQRCSNLRLKCAFSISRIGKVPGKRSKANRVAAAAVSASSSAPISTSSSISTPILSPPIMTAAHSFDAPKAYDGRNAIPISTSSYPFTQEYPTAHSLGSEATYAHSPTYPTQSNPEDLSSLNNLCWTAEFDHLGGPGLLSPDWELDADESIQPLASTTTPIHPDAHSKQYPLLTEPFPSHQYMIYLQLLHGIEQTVQFAHQCKSPGHGSTALSALDSTLVSSQRYTTTLLQLTSNPSFAHTYNEDHLLLSVVLDKLICLYSLAYSDLKRSMEIYDGMSMGITCPGAGSLDRWTRFGAFEMNVAEQMVLCRRTFAEELERARACLGRLMDAMGLGLSTPVSVSSSHGRHESMCEELKRKLDALMDDLERDQGNDGVHLVC